MTEMISTSSGSAGLTAVRRGQVRMRDQAAQSERREQVLAHVDRLVRDMEAAPQRLASDQVSTMQRSVLVSRFNDMQRQVNEIDGVVGSEGRGDAVGQVGAGRSFAVETPQAAERTVHQIRQARQVERPVQERPSAPAPVRPSTPTRRQANIAEEAQGNLVDLKA